MKMTFKAAECQKQKYSPKAMRRGRRGVQMLPLRPMDV
jgi:hypothetical protein